MKIILSLLLLLACALPAPASAYCAAAGQTLHRSDVRYCCNSQPAPQRVSFPFKAGRPSLWVCR